MSAENVRKAASLIKEAMELLAKGPLDFYLTQLCAAHDRLIADFCPFKVGDHVAINYTPTITEEHSHGWIGYKHFLVKGATAVVRSVEVVDGRFTFDLVFDNDHWIDPHTKKRHTRKPEERGSFKFWEGQVVKA